MAHRPLDKTIKIFNTDSNIQGCFQFNCFTEDIEYRKVPIWNNLAKRGDSITDDDLTFIRTYLTTIHEVEPAKSIVIEACSMASRAFSYHPVKEYIEKEEWDGVARLDEWLIKAIGCENNIYTQMAGAKFMIAAVNRIYNPGCKFDHMIILEGAQGLGKSTLVEELAGDWYLDTNFENKDKDLIDSMRRSFLIEISELSGMNKKDVDWMKSFLTKKVDRVRLAYDSRTKDFKRKSVFIGTYNPSGNNTYLRDDTGNRRFWCIECNKVDIDYIKKNKQQLWAEAYSRYKNNERYYIDNAEALKIMTSIHEDREIQSPTYLKLRKWLDEIPYDEITMEDMIEKCLKINIDGRQPKELLSIQTTVGVIVKKLGWRKGTNEDRHKYFRKPKIEEWTE